MNGWPTKRGGGMARPAGLACLWWLAAATAGAQVMEPQLIRPGSVVPWALAADAGVPAPAPADIYAGGNGVDRTIAGDPTDVTGTTPNTVGPFAANLAGLVVAGRAAKDPANAYSVGSDRTMTLSFTAGTAAGTLYLNTYAKGQLTATAQGMATIGATVQVQDMTAGGTPVVLQGIPDLPGNRWALSQAATGVNNFEVGWLNQSVDLIPAHTYRISGRLTAGAGPIPINTIGEDKTDISRATQDQDFNIAFNLEPPIPPGKMTRNPDWRGNGGIRAALAQTTNMVRAGVALDGNNVKIGQFESGNPITTHVDLPAARINLINDGVQFAGANTPAKRSEHATATAGIMVAGRDHGVAPAATLYSASLLSGRLPPAVGLAQGVVTIYQNAVNKFSAQGVTVINNSFGFGTIPGFNVGLQNQMDQFVNMQSATKNIVFVASTGNGGDDPNDNSASTPASASATIAVGALDYTLSKVANFSSAFKGGGEPPNLCAPGSLIDTTVVVPMKVGRRALDPARAPSAYDYAAYGYYQRGRGLSFSGPFDGTSFSAPMVSGAVALYQQLANLPDFAAVAEVLKPKTIRAALMTTAWKTKADGTPLYLKDGVTKFNPAAAAFAPGGPVNEEKTVWAELGAGWLDVYDFLKQLSARAPVKARADAGGGGGGDFAVGGAPSDDPGTNALAALTLTGPRTLDAFEIYPQQQQEFTLPVGLQAGDSVAITVAWDENTNAAQNLDLAIAVYQSESGSTNGNPELVAAYSFDANGDVVLPPYLGTDPLIVYANGGWSTTEHLYFQVNSAAEAGQYYVRVINLSTNTDEYSVSAWVKSPTSYPADAVLSPQFTVTSDAGAGGSVTPTGVMSAGPGTNLVFTASPDPGFEPDQWLVNGVPVATNTTTYTLTDVQTNEFVLATFQIADSALDLAVSPATGEPSVAPGSNVVFYLPVQNYGPAGAENVVVTDWLPPGTTFVSAQASQGVCTFDADSQTLTCELGSLAASNSALVTLTVTAPDSVGGITNEVSVTNDVLDAVPENNTATSVVCVVNPLTVTVSPGTNGTIYPSGSVPVLTGQSQAFGAVPDPNYVVGTWEVDGVAEQEGGTNFVVSDLQSNEVVTVVFAAVPAALPNDFPATVDKGAWVDNNNVAHPWKVGLATSAGPPIYDDQFATLVTPLAQQGVLMHFAFAECFGGGMLQNLAAIPAAAIQLSGTSAAQWNQAAWYREPPYLAAPLPIPNNHNEDWGDTYILNAGGNNNALDTSVGAWNDDPFRPGTVVRPNASGPDESFPYNETAQYRENAAGSGLVFTHNPANGGKYAILYSGRPGGNHPANPGQNGGLEVRPANPNVDAEQIVNLWNLLTDPLGYNYPPANIQVVYGNGALPAGAPANMRGRVVAATLQGLRTAFANLASLTNTNQLFFFANDHGVARNDGMPPNTYLLVPRSPDLNPSYNTNIWLPASPLPSPGAPQGLERYSGNTNDPYLGWAADPDYVAGATILQSPATTNVVAGATAVFSVVAGGTPPLGYQWQLNGVDLAGATNSILVVSNAGLANYGAYTVAVSNNYSGTVTSSVASLYVDGLPLVAAPVPLITVKNQPATLTTQQILSYAHDPAGDPLTVTGVEGTSTNGATVVLDGNTVTYTPVTNYMGADSFTYTVSDGDGSTATGLVEVQVWCSTNMTSIMLPPTMLPGNIFQINFSGPPLCPYELQRATVLTGPWINLGIITTDGTGLGGFVDTNPPPAGAFYRTIYPP